MRNKLVQLIGERNNCPSEANNYCVKCEYRNDLPCWAGIIADRLIANGVTFAEDNNAGKWIPASERLPGKEGVYIVRSETGAAYTSHFYGEKTFASGYCRPSRWTPRGKVKVTHWMPMPEPPKDDE